MRSSHDAVRTRLSPYVTLVAREVQVAGRAEIFHSLEQADYVTVLAITNDGRIPLVRQFRPALGREAQRRIATLNAGVAPA